MPIGKAGWVYQTEGLVALAAAGTAKTVLMAIAGANDYHKLHELGVQFDGVTAAEKPVLIELVRSTQAGAGTTTAVTPRQQDNPATTAPANGGKNYTAEPTVLTACRRWLWDPYKGAFVKEFPLGREPESPMAGGIGLRLTIPTGGAAVNVEAYLAVE